MTWYREFEKQIDGKHKLAKQNYEDKEKMFASGSSHSAWKGATSTMEMQSKKCPISFNGKTNLAFSNELVL